MQTLNKVFLIGFLGKDPTITKASNTTRVGLALATNHAVKKDGEWVEETEWHYVVGWGTLAETCGKYLTKGDMVHIEGRVTSYETSCKECKSPQKNTIINMDKILFLKIKPKNKDNDNTYPKGVPF